MAPFLQTVLDSSAIPSLQGVKFISSDLADLANATAVGGGKYDLVSTLSTVKSLRMGLAGLVCFMIITDQFQRCYAKCILCIQGTITYTYGGAFVNQAYEKFTAGASCFDTQIISNLSSLMLLSRRCLFCCCELMLTVSAYMTHTVM